MPTSVEQDIAAIARIGAVPTILKVVSEITGLGFTLVARVTPDAWYACAVHDEIAFGMQVGDALDVATTLCAEVRATLLPVIVEHASQEAAYCGHPTPKLYGFESYIAVPVMRKNGEYFGNVCGLDPRPAVLREPKTLAMMKLFAELISLQLDADESLERSTAELKEEKATSELREQFIAVLSHDLRNPLGSVTTGATLLGELGLAEPARKTAQRILSSARRMERLIDGLLDLARGRLAGGLPLTLAEVTDIDASVRHVVDELAVQYPDRQLRLRIEGSGSVVCDPQRVEQMVSNLVANAIQHGSAQTPLEIGLRHLPGALQIDVTNRGTPIPPEVQQKLFRPFYRGEAHSGGTGMGLGLYIVSEIAKAHGGTVAVQSSERAGTRFVVTLPRAKSVTQHAARPD